MPKRLMAVGNPAEAPPNLQQTAYQQPCLFCPATVLATPFPRKSRHRSRWEAPPPKHLPNYLSKSLTRITYLLPFLVVSLVSNGCAISVLMIDFLECRI